MSPGTAPVRDRFAVGRLGYASITSLDGYVNDAAGEFDWSAPDAEVHAFVNELERRFTTQLYGRRMYEVLRCGSTPRTSLPASRCSRTSTPSVR